MPRIGDRTIRLNEVDSTNSCALRLLSAGEAVHGLVITAESQTAGRGRMGRTWQDAPGQDLLLSLVLLPGHMPVMDQFQVSKAVALAVRDAVSERLGAAGRKDAELRIKWPNDILLEGRKLAGILIENEVQGDRLSACVVGVGINVNGAMPDAELKATSLWIETGRKQDRDALLGSLCLRLEHWWAQVIAGDMHVPAAYTDALWARGRFTGFTLDGDPFQARPLDVDAQGRLIVEDAQGHVAAYGLDRLRHAAR